MDVIIISSDSSDEEMHLDENNRDDNCFADNETSDSESEAVKIEDMPLLEEFPPRESAPAPCDPAATFDADSDRLIIIIYDFFYTFLGPTQASDVYGIRSRPHV